MGLYFTAASGAYFTVASGAFGFLKMDCCPKWIEAMSKIFVDQAVNIYIFQIDLLDWIFLYSKIGLSQIGLFQNCIEAMNKGFSGIEL